jgi:hypothetical protein
VLTKIKKVAKVPFDNPSKNSNEAYSVFGRLEYVELVAKPD